MAAPSAIPRQPAGRAALGVEASRRLVQPQLLVARVHRPGHCSSFDGGSRPAVRAPWTSLPAARFPGPAGGGAGAGADGPGRVKAANLVLVRHGQSEWNRGRRLTGWSDVPLSEQGREEARAVGRLLARAGYGFELAFTSYLERSIETLELVLAELGQSSMPVQRSWRLNERHYGALQGLDKAETASRHGADQVKIWRRSYDIPPPALSPDDERHPRHDKRYRDVDPNDLPGTESLATTLDRVQPYWQQRILPELQRGRNVLIAAHGNSLRALVKMLEHISEDDITEFNIPTGVPRLYEFDSDMNVTRGEYLGDAEAIAAAAKAVAEQASAGAG